MSAGPLVAFVGLLAPHDDRAANAAFSQAGATFQESLIASLAAAGATVDKILAQRPVPSFPRSRRLFFRRSYGTVAGFPVTYLPFINFGAIKTLTSGISVFVSLVRWAWINRRSEGRAIILYNLTSPPGIASVIAARLTNSSVVAVMADIQVPGSGSVAGSLLRRVEYWAQTATMSRCDGLVALTGRMVADFAPDTPFILMEGAVPPALQPAATRLSTSEDRRSAATGDKVFMFSGELSDLKGVPTLLTAFRCIDDPSVRLWVTGRGPAQVLVEAAASADRRISYLGYPAYKDLLVLYQKATVLVNPHSSSHETARYLFPSKLIEYMATGTPVITTSSTPEVSIEYGAYTFVTGGDTVDDLVNAMSKVLSVPAAELIAKGLAARDFVLSNKSWQAQGRRIVSFIREVIARTNDTR